MTSGTAPPPPPRPQCRCAGEAGAVICRHPAFCANLPAGSGDAGYTCTARCSFQSFIWSLAGSRLSAMVCDWLRRTLQAASAPWSPPSADEPVYHPAPEVGDFRLRQSAPPPRPAPAGMPPPDWPLQRQAGWDWKPNMGGRRRTRRWVSSGGRRYPGTGRGQRGV